MRTNDEKRPSRSCDDAAGIEQSTRLPGEWIGENAPRAAMVTPEAIGGDVIVIVHFGM